MNKFNDTLKIYKDINSDVVKHKDLFITKNSSITTRVNGALQNFKVNNLPLNYKAYLGVHGVSTPPTDKYSIYGKFYVKIVDPFGREVTDFTKNHHLADGLEVSTSISNIENGKIGVYQSDKIGVYENQDNEYTFIVKNNEPIEIRSVKDGVKASETDNTSYETLWIVLGIIGGVLVCVLIIFLFYFFNRNKVVIEPQPKKTDTYRPMNYLNY